MHPRLAASGAEHLDLDHYLEILLRKPGALPGSVPLAQARAAARSPRRTSRCGTQARARLGDGPGTRTLIEVLLLHRRLPAASATAGITAALGAASCSPDVVAVEARKHAGAAGSDGGRLRRRGRPRPSRGGFFVITLPRRHGRCPPTGARHRRWPLTTSCWPAREGGPYGHRRDERPIPRGRGDRAGVPAAAAAADPGPARRDRRPRRPASRPVIRCSWTELLSLECDDREARRKVRLTREAGFPRAKRIEDFDFAANPDVPAALIGTLARCAWITAWGSRCA